MKQLRAGLYSRVSTADQHTENQELELRPFVQRRGWTIENEYEDVVSGTTTSRTGLDQLMEDARAGRIDVAVVSHIDRLGRSLSHLIHTLEQLQAYGVDFVSAGEPLDTTTPSGKLLFCIISSFAEFERNILVERTHAGLARARANGKILGRPRIVLDMDKLLLLRGRGYSIRQIAERLHVGRGTVQRALTKLAQKGSLAAACK